MLPKIAQISAYNKITIIRTHLATIRAHLDEIAIVRRVHLNVVKAVDKDENDEVTPNDVFLHVHTKDHDGVTFIDSISTQFHLIDEEQLYYDTAGVCPKRHVYGLRSLARKTRTYADPESIGNVHGIWCEHLSGTTTATTLGASSTAPPRSRLKGMQGVGEGQLKVLLLRRTVLEQIVD
ncbi:hypothetical protein Syun_001323 [Stephania yunnanensis]|uniref:Uncharacterized protein n=1 Tax=Stephania yunnanensis TaxID=152371 RepID=A0AAP0LDM7_9MAGN